MAIANHNSRDDVLDTFKSEIAVDFKKDEVLHVYDEYKDKSLSTWGLAMDKGYAAKGVAYDPKGIFMCTLIIRVIDKAETIINQIESNQAEKLDFTAVRDIIYDQYDIVLQNEAQAFASVNRKM